MIPTGCVFMFGMSNLPAGWILCQGQAVLISSYPNLFAAIGTNYGGDRGVSTFGIPSLMDRFPVGASAAKPIEDTTVAQGSQTIQVGNLPPHQHSMSHDHPATNTGSSGTHDHQMLLSTADGTAGTARKGTGAYVTGGGPIKTDGAHVHSMNVPN